MTAKSHFLEPLLESGAGGAVHTLRHERTGRTLAGTIELAQDSRTRTRGLLGRSGLADGSVLIIAPCNAIHTLFMRFTIDVIFADRQGRVVKLCRRLRPWRIGFGLGAFAALELAEGAIDRGDVKKGDQLTIC
jgi:uncharacterized membrane protein (UPF0127 family)